MGTSCTYIIEDISDSNLYLNYNCLLLNYIVYETLLTTTVSTRPIFQRLIYV